MHAFLAEIRADKARQVAMHAAMPLMERVRMRSKLASPMMAGSQGLQGREADIRRFLKELYHGQGVTSMNLKEIIPKMTQSLHFIYTEARAERCLILFAKTSEAYELKQVYGRQYIRGIP